MASFGESLRRERELHGVTLAELAAATKINLRYLNALEREQFDCLPGGIFNRGFVRAIARYMDLDEREWVAAYAQAAEEAPEVLTLYALSSSRPNLTRQNWRSFALLLVLFAAGLFAVHSVRARRAAEALPVLVVSAQAAPSATPLPVPLPSASVVTTRVVSAAKSEALSSPEVSSAEAAEVALRLQVDAIEDAWVSISADGRTLYQGLMKSRETRGFRAASELALRTGNASALILTLNGETLPPLGNPGEVKNITLTRKDLAPPRP